MQSGGSGPKRISSQGQPRAIQLLNPNRLKIVGGTAKGKKIDSPDVYLRPMMAKVRMTGLKFADFTEIFIQHIYTKLNFSAVGARSALQHFKPRRSL